MQPLVCGRGLEDTGWVGLRERMFSTALRVILCVGYSHFSVSALKVPNLHPHLYPVGKPVVPQSEPFGIAHWFVVGVVGEIPPLGRKFTNSRLRLDH